MKLCYKLHEYNGKTYRDYYLMLDNGRYIQIKNVFKNDYESLKAIAYPMDKGTY